MNRKYFIICLVCAFWTIIQTSFHLVFVIFSYYMRTCQASPTDSNAIFFYLTYLYNRKCSTPSAKSIPNSSSPEYYIYHIINIYSNNSDTFSVGQLVDALLARLEYFPDSAAYSSRTTVFLLCFIILDGTWIVSAVSLLMGTCFGIKEGLSLVFYGPWLVMTVCISIFDAVASVFFGFDIANTMLFDDWISFVGIPDPSQFSNITSKEISSELLAAPSLALCTVSARFILIWLSNIVGFIFVMKATISVFHESYKNEDPHHPRSLIESAPRTRLDHDTSAARIRSWQMFYGSVDTNNSVDSSKSVELEKDISNNNARRESRETEDNANGSNYYHAYPDVVDSVLERESGGYLEELRGQLPWSYTQGLEGGNKEEERIDMENVRRHYRIKSDSSNSGTEL